MRILAWGLTDVGSKRDHNEDSLLVSEDLGLFAVADGMGGHQGGERASRLAVEILERELRKADFGSTSESGAEPLPAQFLNRAAITAGQTIFGVAQREPQLSGMGTTLTSLLFHGSRVYLAHVGDSRAYLFRDERIERLTEDHSWIEEQVRSGFMTMAEAEASSFKHIITRSVGFEKDVEVDLLTWPFLMGDCFLLCSDGLTNLLSDEEIRSIISSYYYADVPRRLVDAANENGGEDNITVVIVYIGNDARPRGEDSGRTTLPRTEEGGGEDFDPYATTVDR